MWGKKCITIFVTSFLVVCGMATSVHVAVAHGLAITQQQRVGDYIVEFEHDSTGQVVSGEPTSYAFELLYAETSEQVSYERMFVKIVAQGASRPTFSGNLVPVELLGRKTARANITLFDVGAYTAELGFFSGGAELAKATFVFDVAQNPLTVPVEDGNARQYAYIAIFVVLLITVILQAVWLHRKKELR